MAQFELYPAVYDTAAARRELVQLRARLAKVKSQAERTKLHRAWVESLA